MQPDLKAIKRHWHLVVYEIPRGTHSQKVSMYVWSRKRLLSVPELATARHSRQVPPDAVLVNSSYLGMGTQYDLTGESPEPVTSVVSTQYLLGMRAATQVTDPTQATNPFGEGDAYAHAEWQQGYEAGLGIRAHNPAALNQAH